MKLSFVTRISKSGNRWIISIPSEFAKEAIKLRGNRKQVKVTLDDEI
jgi:hypothetical protein